MGGMDIKTDIAANCDQGVPEAYWPTIPRNTIGRVKVDGLVKKVQERINSDQPVRNPHRAVTAMPGAREIVAFGREQNLPMALATSGMRAHADISLAETGLAGNFDVEVTGDEVQRGKPAPDLFLLAAERLGVSPETAVVFEDSPLGVEAAVAAGMAVIAIEGGRTVLPPFPVAPDLLVPTLIDALAWLREQRIEPAR